MEMEVHDLTEENVEMLEFEDDEEEEEEEQEREEDEEEEDDDDISCSSDQFTLELENSEDLIEITEPKLESYDLDEQEILVETKEEMDHDQDDTSEEFFVEYKYCPQEEPVEEQPVVKAIKPDESSAQPSKTPAVNIFELVQKELACIASKTLTPIDCRELLDTAFTSTGIFSPKTADVAAAPKIPKVVPLSKPSSSPPESAASLDAGDTTPDKSPKPALTEDKTCVCDKCGAEMGNRGGLGKHKMFQHKFGHFYCPACEFKGQTKYALLFHQTEAHPGEFTNKCSKCPFINQNRYSMEGHDRAAHGQKTNVPRVSKVPRVAPLTPPEDPNTLKKRPRPSYAEDFFLERETKMLAVAVEKRKCQYCSSQFKTQVALNEHVDQLHPNLKCTLCSYHYRTSDLFLKHKLAKHPDVVWTKCPHCHFETCHKGIMPSHVESAHFPRADAVYRQCPHCEYKSKVNFPRHLSTHDKPMVIPTYHYCRECQYRDEHKDGMFQHMSRTHLTGTTCKLCDSKFESNVERREHVFDKHVVRSIRELQSKKEEKDSETELACDLCAYKTRRKRNLQHHMRFNHTPEYQLNWKHCPVCPQRFKTKYFTYVHMYRRHTDHKKKCAICHKTAKNLKQHIWEGHRLDGSSRIVKEESKPVAKTSPKASKPVAKVTPQPAAKAPTPPALKAPPKPLATALSKPVAKTQPIPVAKAPPKPAAKTQPKPVTKAPPRPVANTQPKPVTKAPPKPVAKTQPMPVAKAPPRPVAKTQPKPVAKAPPKPVAKTQPKPVAKAPPKPVAKQPTNTGEGENLRWFKCGYCPFQSLDTQILANHVLSLHVQRPEVHAAAAAPAPPSKKNRVSYNLKCPDCGQRAPSKTALTRHRNSKHLPDDQVTWFYCPHCPHKCKRKDGLAAHVLSKHRNLIVCEVCTFRCSSKKVMDKHKLLIHPASKVK